MVSKHNTAPQPEKEPNYKLRRLAVISGIGAIAAVGVGFGVAKGLETTVIAETQVEIDGSAIGTIRDARDELVEIAMTEHNIAVNPNSILDVNYAGSEVESDLLDLENRTHPTVQPGEQIDLTLTKNNFGTYRVSADPANLGDMDKNG